MVRVLGFVLSLTFTAQALAASEAASPQAPACRRALDALDARAAAVLGSADRDGARAHIEALRRQAALACLGGRDAPRSAPLRPRASPPVAVPSAAVAATAPPVRPSATPLARDAPPAGHPPLTLTACDAAGCWTSDGTRLQRAGSVLLGPRGVCQVSGPFVQCAP
ncbi:MAG TPA: hypothetical protein VFQ20_07960 [Burkholderiaceae bacterium]|nr:hypothetical protein [Burkholderiaceae bacterium]